MFGVNSSNMSKRLDLVNSKRVTVGADADDFLVFPT